MTARRKARPTVKVGARVQFRGGAWQVMPLNVMVAPATNRDDGPARDLLFRLRLAHRK